MTDIIRQVFGYYQEKGLESEQEWVLEKPLAGFFRVQMRSGWEKEVVVKMGRSEWI